MKLDYRQAFFSSPMPLRRRRKRAGVKLGDRRDDAPYVYKDERIVLAINVALATKRPLLISGPPGSGKSSLARDVANRLGRTYYAEVIGSRTKASDLIWTYDAVARLADVQANPEDPPPRESYVDPGPLWWALSPETAAALPKGKGNDPGEPPGQSAAVVLFDEVDKADPSVPNDLLVPIGEGVFDVPHVGGVDATRECLLVFTTNGDRSLPDAFIRRCIALDLPEPPRERLLMIARAHFPRGNEKLFGRLADMIVEEREKARSGSRRPPSTAEFLDAIAAVMALKPKPAALRQLFDLAVVKAGSSP